MLVALEATDPISGAAFQARHSYTVDDIRWDATFVPCARRQPSGGIRIDFEMLHAVLPLGNLQPPSELMRIPTADLPLSSSLSLTSPATSLSSSSSLASALAREETDELRSDLKLNTAVRYSGV